MNINRRFFIRGVASFALMGLVATSVAATLSVSENGAVRSPETAVAKIREMRAAGTLAKGELATISFAPGIYPLSQTLEVTADVAPIVFEGAGGGRTVFSGGRNLGPFTAGEDGIWRCPVPAGMAFEQLWVNGRRAARAKSPNKFYHYVMTHADEGVDPLTGKQVDLSRRQFFTKPESLACLANLPADELAEVAIHVWWAWDDEWRNPAKVDVAKGEVILTEGTKRDFFMWPKWCPRFTIENCRTALDAPGEWFHDKKAGQLLYVPRAGETPGRTYAVAPVLDRLVLVHDVEGVEFRRIAFEHNGWTLPPGGFFCRQSAYLAASALLVTNAAQVVFRDCQVAHTADYGLWFGAGTHDSSVVHSLFQDLGAGGVRLGACDWKTNTPPEQVTQRIRVDDNIIVSGGHVFAAGTGVFITFAKDCTVTHNEICDLYYSGICCGWRWGYAPAPNRDNELSWNHIHHLGKGVLSDMGFIYTLGDSRGTVVKGNHGHDMFSYGYTGSGGTGLYPDEGSRGILWTSNLVHHTKTSALSQHYGRDNFFKNNIFAFSTKPDSSVAGRWRVEKHTSLICSNNVFMWRAGHHAWRGPGKGRPAPVHDLVFGSNLWWSPDPIATNAFNGGTWEKWREDGMDEGSLIADPLFRNWQAGDWRLKPESPALKIGFDPWDYTFAGVRKEDAAWRALAASLEPAGYEVAPEPPLYAGRTSFRTGFEGRRAGSFPQGTFMGSGSGRDRGYIMVSTRAHRTGAKALELRDFKGLATRYWPHAYQRFKISGERFVLKFSLKSDKLANFICEWREWTPKARNGQYADGPYFSIQNEKFHLRARRAGKDGTLRPCSIPFPEYVPDTWCDLVFTVHTPKEGVPTFDFSLATEAGKVHEEKGLHFVHSDCLRPDWIGFLSNADCETVTFLDDYSYVNE